MGRRSSCCPWQPDKTFLLGHVYADNGSYTITVAVNDGTATGIDAVNVAVGNVAPTVDAGPNGTIATGATFSSAGSFTDPGADTWTGTVDYGDGTGVQPLTLAADKSFALSHPYATAGGYTVTVTVTDDDGGTDNDTATVTVEDVVVPTLAVGDVELAEGDAGQQTATFTVTRAGPTTGTSTVDFATADGTATGTGAAGADADLDGVANSADNCPGQYNSDQRDDDADTVGTRCDATPIVDPSAQVIVGYSRDGTAAPLLGGLHPVHAAQRRRRTGLEQLRPSALGPVLVGLARSGDAGALHGRARAGARGLRRRAHRARPLRSRNGRHRRSVLCERRRSA